MTSQRNATRVRVERGLSLARAVELAFLLFALTLVGCANESGQGGESAASQTEMVSAQPGLAWQVTTLSCGATQTQDSLSITNTGTTSIALSSIAVKLWIDDTTGQTVVPHVWTGGCITGVNGNPSCSHQVSGGTASATHFSTACGPDPSHQANWEVAVSNTDKTLLPPGATWSGLQVALNLANYSNFVPGSSSWYSACVPGNAPATNLRYAVYVQGTPVSGAQPPPCRRPQGSQLLSGSYVPAAVATAPFVGPLPAASQVQLSVGLPLRNPQDLKTLLTQVSDPHSSKYRQYLTPNAFAAAYGPMATDYQKLISFATSNGLSITKTYGNNQLLDVIGTVANIESAFHVFMNVYRRSDGSQFYAPDTTPSVDFAIPILRVNGLDNFRVPKRADGSGEFNFPFESSLYTGSDFRNAYAPGVKLTGAGQTLALVEFDGFSPADITAYENGAGPPVTPFLMDGATGKPVNPTTQFEVTLDIEMAAAMAPGLDNIYVYEGPTPLGPSVAYDVTADDLLTTMAFPPPGLPPSNQISCSWFGFGGENVLAAIQEFAAQGQSFFMASGDSGAYGNDNPMQLPYNEEEVDWMTLVGGTELFTKAGGGAWTSERTWNDAVNHAAADPDATSGGVTTGVLAPSYQAGIATQIATAGGNPTWRNFPDVSMVATEIQIQVYGSPLPAVGTSAAAPLWAAFVALANQQAAALGRAPIGFANPAIYAIGQGAFYSQDFHDIADGSTNNRSGSGPFQAITGYDLATGWGSPTGMSLIDDLAESGSPCVAVDNGTDCGTDEVCDNERCVACTAGVACVPANTCHQSTTSCATGEATCPDTGSGAAAPNGTPCGVDQVCDNAQCVACTADVACVPANACHVGATSCTTGESTCVDTGAYLPDGVTGIACAAPTACSDGAIVCSAGAPSCYSASCGTCSVGTGACQATGTLDSNGVCSVVPGTPQPGPHTLPAPNGSWDWDCDGRTEQQFPVGVTGSAISCSPASDGGFCSSIGNDERTCTGKTDNLGDFYFPCSGGDIVCGELLLHQQCFFGSSCKAGPSEVVQLGCQ
jgi:Pro-kumamolisin, activation domain